MLLALLGGAVVWQVRRTRPGRLAPPAMVMYENLLAAFHNGEFVGETRSLDLGSERGRAQCIEANRHAFGAATGILPRPDGSPPFAWLVGRAPALDLDVLQPLDRELEVQLASGVPGPQRVTLRLNGKEIGARELPADGGPATLALPVAAALQHRGRNRLEFAFDAVDTRQLADEPVVLPIAGVITHLRFAPPGEASPDGPVAQHFGLVPAGQGGDQVQNLLAIPPGLSASVAVRVPDTTRVALAFTLRATSVPLELSVLPDQGPRTVLHVFQPSDDLASEVRYDLSPWAGQALLIEFWARAGQGAGARIGPAHVRVPAGSRLARGARDESAASADLGPVRPDSPPSFLVVVLDALSRRQISAHRKKDPITPVLDGLAADGIAFPDATSPACYTLAAVGSLLTGQDPLTHGVAQTEDEHGIERLADDAPRLAALLADAGWRTAAFITNPNAAARHGYGEGFERYEELFADPALWKPGVSGAELAPRLAEFLDQVGSAPYLAYVHVFEPHAPYDAPADLTARFVPAYAGAVRGDRDWIDAFKTGRASTDAAGMAHLADLYAARVGLADRVLGELLQVVRNSGRGKDTVLVVLSDHGEAFGEHGLIEHGDQVYGEQVEVPLVFVVPGRSAAKRGGPATVTDVAPTILGLAGLQRPDDMDGIDLLAAPPELARPLLTRSAARLPELGWTRWPMRLVVDLSTRRAELYDLLHDPGERSDLAGARPATTALLYRELADAVCAAEAARRPPAPGEALGSGPIAEQLRAIGYVGAVDEGASGDAARLCDLLRLPLRRP